MPKPTPDEIRRRLLDAGVAVFVRTLDAARPGGQLAHLALKEVAAEAGYRSPGMIYLPWADDEDGRPPRERFEADLIERLAEEATGAEHIAEAIASIDDWSDADAIVRHVANSSFGLAMAHPGNQIFEAVIARAAAGPSRSRLAEAELEQTSALAAQLDTALPDIGRRWGPDATPLDVAWILRSLEFGLWQRVRLVDELEGGPHREHRGSDGWTLYAVAVSAILEHLTVPDAEDTRAGDDVIDD